MPSSGPSRPDRSGLPWWLPTERLVDPPLPEDPALRARWRSLDHAARRRVRREANGLSVVEDRDEDLVRGLARARLRTGWRLRVTAVVLGTLVLMTVWGFGRATVGDDAATPHLVVGLVGGLVVTMVSWARASRRLARVREVAGG